jgi:hypothetical protein
MLIVSNSVEVLLNNHLHLLLINKSNIVQQLVLLEDNNTNKYLQINNNNLDEQI